MTKLRPAKLFFIILALTTFITTAFFFQKHAPEIISWVHQLGWLAPVLFVLIYCLATLMFLPTMVITLAGGALFGPVIGTLLNLLGATLGAASSFLITRYVLADWFSRTKNNKIKKLIQEAEQKGWALVAILRLFPIAPFNLVNYGLGITSIKFRTYLLATLIFLIPPEIIYTYLGYAGMDALLQPGSVSRSSGIIISGAAIIALCLCKSRLVNINKFHFKRAKMPLNAQSADALLPNQPHQENEPLEPPAKNS